MESVFSADSSDESVWHDADQICRRELSYKCSNMEFVRRTKIGYSLTLILDCQSCIDIGRQTSAEPVNAMNELVNGGVTGVVIITALLEITSCV